MALIPMRHALIEVKADHPRVPAIPSRSVLVVEELEICLMLDADTVHAGHHPVVLPALVADLLAALACVGEVMLQCLFGEHLKGAKELKLELDVPQVHPCALRRPQVIEVHPQPVGEEDSVGIDLHGPVILQVSAVVLHRLPHLDEGVNVLLRRRVSAIAQLGPLKKGVPLAPQDAPLCRLDVVRQGGLRVPEGGRRRVIPHHHAEAEQGGALGEHALGRGRRLPRVGAPEDGAVPTRGRGIGPTSGVRLVLLVARVPLELCEVPIRNRHVRATLGVDTIITRPCAIRRGREPWLHLVNSIKHRVDVLRFGDESAIRRVELFREGDRLRRGLGEQVAMPRGARPYRLLTQLLLAAPIAAVCRGFDGNL
mmetsp:Transcript_108826/g.304699  ORF Transcript_108826/g.304699 Transcript_108826/m.304699 type:complete len:368 (+) Transcript_108826:318-1421(+)